MVGNSVVDYSILLVKWRHIIIRLLSAFFFAQIYIDAALHNLWIFGLSTICVRNCFLLEEIKVLAFSGYLDFFFFIALASEHKMVD